MRDHTPKSGVQAARPGADQLAVRPRKYPFYSGGDGVWRCIYVNNAETQEVDTILRKEPRSTNINQLRRRFRQALAQGGFRKIAPGDVAGIQTTNLEDTVVHSILMLVGRKVIFLDVYHASEGQAIEAARLVAGVA